MVSPEAGAAAASFSAHSPGAVLGDQHPSGSAPHEASQGYPHSSASQRTPSPSAGHGHDSATEEQSSKRCRDVTTVKARLGSWQSPSWQTARRHRPTPGKVPVLLPRECDTVRDQCVPARGWPCTRAPQGPSCRAKVTAQLQGCSLGDGITTDPQGKKGFPLHGTIPAQPERRIPPLCPPAVLGIAPLHHLTHAEKGKIGMGARTARKGRELLCEPKAQSHPCWLRAAVCPMELREHMCTLPAPSPRQRVLPVPSLQSRFAAQGSSRKAAVPTPWQTPASRWGGRLRSQPGALSLSPHSALPAQNDRYPRAGKSKGHCAALCKVKYICTAPWAAFLGGWKDKQDFLQELETMGG